MLTVNARTRIRVIVLIAAVCTTVLLVSFARWYSERFEHEMMAAKTARKAYATVLAKRWDAAGARGKGRGILDFKIVKFDFTDHPSSIADTDALTARRLLQAEQQVGVRSRDVVQSLYREVEVGDGVTVLYRMSGGRPIEIITIEGVYLKTYTEQHVAR